MRWLRWSVVTLIVLGLAGCLSVGFFGSAVVHDETGDVIAAVITNDREEQAMWRLPGGLFFAVPGLEGTIEVRCRGGSRSQWGYVTRHMHTWLRVERGPGCGRIVETG
jgi:hypothetical protein